MHTLKPKKLYKIVLKATPEDFDMLLRIKKCLGDKFYVRNLDGALTGFVVPMVDKSINLLDDDLKDLVVEMADEGIKKGCVAFLYRMMDEKYIDQFLKEGKLRLSSFVRCAGLETSERKDCSEGSVEVFSKGSKAASGSIGKNAYLLCASLSPFAANPNGFTKCLCIQYVEGFIDAVTAGLRKKGVLVDAISHGPCIYSSRLFECDDLPARTEENLRSLFDSFGDRLYFMKDATPSFMIEHEYRILWLKHDGFAADTIDVAIDDPQHYASKIEIPKYESIARPPYVISESHPIVLRKNMIHGNEN